MTVESSVAVRAKMLDQTSNRCTLPIPRQRDNPFKFAHPSKYFSIIFGSQHVELSSMNRVGIMLYAQGERRL